MLKMAEPLSREYLLARGYCCSNGCRNCPYGDNDEAETQSDATISGELAKKAKNTKRHQEDV